MPQDEDLYELAKVVSLATPEKAFALAQQYGYKRVDSLSRALKPYGCYRKVKVPISDKPIYDDPPQVTAPSCLILFDPHFNWQHGEFITRCLDLANSWDVHTLVWGGDYLDFNVFARFISWPDEQFEDEMLDFIDTQKAADQIFKKQIAIKGNHEERLDRLISHAMMPERAQKVIDITKKMTLSEYHFALYRDWIIGHPDDYSRLAARNPAKAALVHQKNVVFGHNHYCGIVKAEDGIHWGIDAGCCCDVRRFRYKALHVSVRPNWVLGALILMDGHPYLLHEDLDWKAMAKLYRREI